MKKFNKVLIAIMILSTLVLFYTGCGEKSKKPLLCYVGSYMRPPMEKIAKLYEEKTGQKVIFDVGGGGELLIKIEQTKRGDIYVYHDPYPNALIKKQLGEKMWPIASLTPVIVIPKGNPKNIKSLKDLTRPDLRVGLSMKPYSNVAFMNEIIFKKAGLLGDIEKNIAMRAKCDEIAMGVKMGSLDAAIIWNARWHLYKESLDYIPIPPEFLPQKGVDTVTSATYGVFDLGYTGVGIVTLKCSKQPEVAKAFAEFVASPTGKEIFIKHNFSPAK